MSNPTNPSTCGSISLRLFGTIELCVRGEPRSGIRTHGADRLLALLVLRGEKPALREWLAETLWPDARHDLALNYLRRTLSALRQSLGPEAWRILSPTPRSLRLDLTNAECDLLSFDAALAQGDAASLERAIGLYSDPLLKGMEEEWVLAERARREEAFASALAALAELRLTEGATSEAARLLHRAILQDPLRESLHGRLMGALAQSGDYAAVTRQYRDLRRILREEVNAEPSEETKALYERLKAQSRATVEEPVDKVARPLRIGRLPCPLTPLIGRAEEIVRVVEQVLQNRLVTLTGTGGVGKTRLAIAVAEEVPGEKAQGAWFVDLSTISDPAFVWQSVASALSVSVSAGSNAEETVIEYLSDKRLLLILDNCEQVVEQAARTVRTILSACPGVRILATSRQALEVAGEQCWPVPPLEVPAREAVSTEVSALQRVDAVALFVDRARRSHPPFRLREQNAGTVSRICRHLDGLPLAIELAAARVRSLTVTEIESDLVERFRLLRGSPRMFEPRQQTLKAVFDWSYALLSETEKRLFRRLSIFVGGWTLQAAEGICADVEEPPHEIWQRLAGLIDKSMVVYEEREGASRYRLLETVRHYARGRLVETGEAAQVQDRHRDYFLALAEAAEPKLRGSEQGLWLERLEAEHDNLRAALEGCASEVGGAEAGLRMAGALWRFWEVRGHWSEGRRYLEEALKREGAAARTKARGTALTAAGILACNQGDYGAARPLFEESLAIARVLGNQQGIASSLNNLGNMVRNQGDYGTARALYEESLAIARELGNKQGIAAVLVSLGLVAEEQGDYETAKALHQESLSLMRELGNKQGIAAVLNNLANVALHQGDYAAARTLYEEALTINRELGNRAWEAQNLGNLGLVAMERRDYRKARSLYAQSLAIERELGDTLGIAESLENGAELTAREGQPARAARLWGAVEALREVIGAPLPPGVREEYERNLTTVREALGKEGFTVAWAEGRGMTLEQVIAYAMEEETAAA